MHELEHYKVKSYWMRNADLAALASVEKSRGGLLPTRKLEATLVHLAKGATIAEKAERIGSCTTLILRSPPTRPENHSLDLR